MMAPEKHTTKRKVLMILYGFPPCNDVGSYRANKFIKYLENFGWYPVVLAPSNGAYLSYELEAERNMLEQCEIIRTPMLFPFSFLLRFRSLRIRSFYTLLWRAWNRIAVPDGAICCLRMAILKARKIVRDRKIKVVLTSGQPFSVFIIAALLKLIGPGKIKIILDYRDPWALNPFKTLSGLKARVERFLEIFVLKHMDAAVFVTEEMRQFEYEGFRRYLNPDRLFTITNSCIEIEQKSIQQTMRQNNEFVIVHAGNFHGNRGPEKFIKALSIAVSWNVEFARRVKVTFYGLLVRMKLHEVANKYNVMSLIGYQSRIPQSEIIPILQNAHILLLINAYGPGHHVFIPAKFLDYVKVKRPILCLAEEGALSSAIKKTRTGLGVNPVDAEQIARGLLTLYEEHNSPERNFWPE